jgi:predicted transcriptional regulator
MKYDARLEVKLSAERRQRLDDLAAGAGVSSAALARLAIGQLLEQRDVTLRLVPKDQQAA